MVAKTLHETTWWGFASYGFHVVASAAVGDLDWIDATELLVEGRGWNDTAHPFDRLPARAEAVVNEHVWRLSRCAAGLGVRFVTDSPTIAVRWRLVYPELSLSRFAASGHSGVDLYTRHEDRWRYLATGQPEQFPENEATLVGALPEPEVPLTDAIAGTGTSGEPAGPRRELLVNLPLFNGVEAVEIGIAAGYTVVPGEPIARQLAPICVYGTSIVQGASASRPGMAHVALLRRRLDRPFLNLGFAGNGQMHEEVAPLLAELEVAAFIVDCLPNMNAALVAERAEPFLATLATSRPDTPIVVVGSITYAGSRLQPSVERSLHDVTEAQANIVDRLRSQGHHNVIAIDGSQLLGDDDEATVDTVHPSDLGFVRMADHLQPVLAQVCSEP